MENKVKHLELIQNVINRMATNSFILKGWTVTIVSAIFVFDKKDANNLYLLVSLLPIISFWMLDGYFLRQERMFRKLYDMVRKISESEVDFSMNTSTLNSNVPNWFMTTTSRTLMLFYGSILIAVLVSFFVGH